MSNNNSNQKSNCNSNPNTESSKSITIINQKIPQPLTIPQEVHIENVHDHLMQHYKKLYIKRDGKNKAHFGQQEKPSSPLAVVKGFNVKKTICDDS